MGQGCKWLVDSTVNIPLNKVRRATLYLLFVEEIRKYQRADHNCGTKSLGYVSKILGGLENTVIIAQSRKYNLKYNL